ncbi:MAG TPA: hypothetical protein VFV55_02965 [Usitatibacteraceae bacterium]|nr:hypothetical protein [Usitatibacteraceae bacterium]
MNLKKLTLALAALAALPFAVQSAEPETEAVEYYNLTTNHYFITATASEARIIDDGGAGPGWVRTGRSFQAWLDPAKAPSTASEVCRFYSTGANSHFYTGDAAECASLKSLEAAERSSAQATGAPILGWRYEGIGFRIEMPASGSCPAGTLAISRVYNNGFTSGEGSNHRFVDDSQLRDLMVDRSWVAEGVAICARAKPNGSDANLGPTTTNFDPLAAAWTGTARWKKEAGAVETRVAAPLALTIAADGKVDGSGQGCAFTGQVQSGDGFRSLFSGTISASGCTDAAFSGAYSRFQLERFGNGTLAVHMKRGDNANEASVEAVLTTGAPPVTPPPSTNPSAGGITGDWAGTVGWTALQRQGGTETFLVESNRPLQLAISSGGAIAGSGFGCSFSGTLSTTSVAGIFGGSVSASGCTEGVFNGTYATVKVKRDDAMLEVEFEKESETAGVTTKVQVEGKLVSTAVLPTTPVNPPSPPAGIAGTYKSAFTADIEIRDRSNGSDNTTTSSLSSESQFNVTTGGGVSGTGFACSFNGTLTLTDAALQLHTGTITATGCSSASLNGSYTASAHPENGGALQLEMERESEVANVRTKVRIHGTAPRTGA